MAFRTCSARSRSARSPTWCWEPAFFGAKPKIVLKGGVINWALMGDPNASLPTPQPAYYRPMFGAQGKLLNDTCVTFVSQAAEAAGVATRLELERQVIAVKNTRKIGKKDMVRNAQTPAITVSPETFAVTVDGVCDGRAAEDGLPQPEILLQLRASRHGSRRESAGQCRRS